jgi:hypothetical protein
VGPVASIGQPTALDSPVANGTRSWVAWGKADQDGGPALRNRILSYWQGANLQQKPAPHAWLDSVASDRRKSLEHLTNGGFV